jgi:hypothetical protein
MRKQRTPDRLQMQPPISRYPEFPFSTPVTLRGGKTASGTVSFAWRVRLDRGQTRLYNLDGTLAEWLVSIDLGIEECKPLRAAGKPDRLLPQERS